MATITRTPSNNWKALVLKRGWPAAIKTFRTKQDARDWARRVEDEMVRGAYIDRAPSEKTTLRAAMARYLAEVTPAKAPVHSNGKPVVPNHCWRNWAIIRWLPSHLTTSQRCVLI